VTHYLTPSRRVREGFGVDVSQVSAVMSVQDPFVLDHNTTSNVTERLRADVAREFQRASAHCRRHLLCTLDGDAEHAGIDGEEEHAGIVALLSVSGSAVDSGTASSPQLVVSASSQAADDAAAAAHMQLFVLKHRQRSRGGSATQVVPRASRRGAAVELGESDGGAVDDDDGVAVSSWHRGVVDTVRLMLNDVLRVESVPRERPTLQFDSHLRRLLAALARRSSSSSLVAPSQTQVSNVTSEMQPPYTASVRDCTTKHPLAVDDRDIDGVAAGTDGSRRHQVAGPAAKRCKPDASGLDVDAGNASCRRHLNVGDDEDKRRVLLSVECSARCRVWVGRKKVRRQLLHLSDELERQRAVTAALSGQMTASDEAVVEFELAVMVDSADRLLAAMLPTRTTSKEFGCFVMFFVSLLQKLIDSVAVEGPVVL